MSVERQRDVARSWVEPRSVAWARERAVATLAALGALALCWPAGAATAGSAPAAPGGSEPPGAAAPAQQVGEAPAELPPAEVEVRLVLAPDDTPLAERQVELLAPAQGGGAPTSWKASSDASGVARFRELPLQDGVRLTARAEHQGVTYETQSEGRELLLRLYPVSRELAGLRISRLDSELRLWEGSVHVSQQLTLVNGGQRTVDLRRPVDRPADRSGDLVLSLPEGAVDVHATGSDTRAVDGLVRYAGLLRPGGEHAVQLRVRFRVPTGSSTLELRQRLPVPLDEALIVVPRWPTVLGRPVPDVALTALGHGELQFRERSAQGGSFWVGEAAGGAPLRELRYEVSGLPTRSRAPAWAVVILTLLMLSWGLIQRRRAPAGRPAAGEARVGGEEPGRAAAGGGLTPEPPGERREARMARLVALERERLNRRDPQHRAAEREALLQALTELELLREAGPGAPTPQARR